MFYFLIFLSICSGEITSVFGDVIESPLGPTSISYTLPHLDVKLFDEAVSVASYGFRVLPNVDMFTWGNINVPSQVALLGSNDCEEWQILKRADGVKWGETYEQKWTIAENERKSFFCYAIFINKAVYSSEPVTVANVHFTIGQSECCEDPEDCEDYLGHKNVTGTGAACAPWSVEDATEAEVVDILGNPKERGLKGLNGNRCRGVGQEKKPWCFSADDKTRASCDIPQCPESQITKEQFLGVVRRRRQTRREHGAIGPPNKDIMLPRALAATRGAVPGGISG